MESMNFQTEPDNSNKYGANNQKANPPPVHKLLSAIANFNLLEKYRARDQQILIHNEQWQQRKDADNNHEQHQMRFRHQH